MSALKIHGLLGTDNLSGLWIREDGNLLRDYRLSGGGGWIRTTEANATDLQSAPFGHSGTPPYEITRGAGGRIRTPDLLITNQLLYQLSYTST